MSDPSPIDETETYAAAALAFLDLPFEPAWLAPISANLRVLAAAAELVAGFPLPDGLEAAPRFEA